MTTDHQAPQSLPSFPVDDVALDAVLHGLAGAYEVDDEGNHILVPMNGQGGDFSFQDVLKFYSGYDPAHQIPCTDESGHTHDDIVEYPGVQYVYADVIQALITEVRRLREADPSGSRAGGDDG